jgi:hypothetical protein
MFTFQRESGAFCRRRRVAGQGIVWATEPGPCTHARIVRFLIQFGYGDDPRTRAGVNWILDNPRSDGMWHCREDRHNCLRATVDALRVAALDAEAAQHPAIQRGAEIVCNLLLQRGMTKYHVGSPWTTLEYPYVDYGLIPTLDALARLGYVADDPRITQAWNCLVGRQLPSGAWPLDRKRARLPFDVGQPGEANKWLTLDALKAIRQLHGA